MRFRRATPGLARHKRQRCDRNFFGGKTDGGRAGDSGFSAARRAGVRSVPDPADGLGGLAVADRYDIGAIAFAAPHLVASWGIERSALGPVLSANNIGVLFGSAIFGWIGDRYGRKTALISANLVFGVLTFAAAYSHDLTQLFWLRLFAGIGIGGVIPNLVAICTESAPRNLRATLPIVAVGCVPLGGTCAGLVSMFLVPRYGWPILFQIGGIVPIVIALAAIFNLPESIKYMALHERQRPKMTKLIEALRPGVPVPANARFIIEDERQMPSSNPIYLFQHGLCLITPLTWLLFALNLMGYFFLSGWTPTLLTAAKLPPATAALAAAILQLGGTVGALSMCWWLQRHRFLAISFLFVLAVPVVGSIGFAGLTSQAALLAATFFAGFIVLGIQIGINVWSAPCSTRPRCAPTVRAGSSASAASARLSGRLSARCSSACRYSNCTCGRHCPLRQAPSFASPSTC